MSTEQLWTPPGGDFELDPKAALQLGQDAHFLERAPHVLPGRIGKFVLVPRDLDKRSEDDVTRLEQYFLPADTERTEAVLHRFSRMFPNIPECARAIDKVVEEQGLQDSKQLVIATNHSQIFDVLGINYTLFSSEVFGDRTAEDNSMYISRQLGYVAFRTFGDTSKILPQIRSTLTGNDRYRERLKKMLSTAIEAVVDERTVTEAYVLAGCNALQVFPYTRSMQPLIDKHGDTIFDANKRTGLASARHQKTRQSDKTQILLVATPGSQAKAFEDGIMLEPTFAQTFDMLYKSYEAGVPVMAMGFEVDIAPAALHLPELHRGQNGLEIRRRPARIAVSRALTLADGLSREEFERALNRAHMQNANKVSKKRVYQDPSCLM